jgi:hypothetical protein
MIPSFGRLLTLNPLSAWKWTGAFATKTYHSTMGAPVGSADIWEKCPFHQLPPAGSGRYLNGEKNFGYRIIFQKHQAAKLRVQNWTNVPR